MTENKTLLDLYDRLSELEDTLENVQSSEIPDELRDALDDLLKDRNTVQVNYEQKLNNILLLIKNREDWIKIRSGRIEELRSLIKTDKNLVDRLKTYLIAHLTERGTTKIRTRDFNVAVAKNGGKTPIIVDEDIDLDSLPEEYLKITKAIDKTAIAEALKSGTKLDFAREGIRQNHLRLK